MSDEKKIDLPSLSSDYIRPALAGQIHAAAYERKAAYALNLPIRFPDFVLTYIGQSFTQRPYPSYAYHFVISDVPLGGRVLPKRQLVVQCSADLGAGSPVTFDFSGETYSLEWNLSSEVGPLTESEIVVTPLSKWPRAAANQWVH